jgi:predicted HicB family RNase H-like nuclease
MKAPLVREKLTLRLPPKLHRSLKAVAVDNGRSLNAEIVQRLRRSFEAPDPTTTAAVVGVGEEER